MTEQDVLDAFEETESEESLEVDVTDDETMIQAGHSSTKRKKGVQVTEETKPRRRKKASTSSAGKNGRGDPTTTWEDIDAAKAEEYLKKNKKNRPDMRKSAIKRYAATMLAGKWEIHGEPLQFDWNGNLVNGQHQLNAVLLAAQTKPDVSIRKLVVRGVDPKSYHAMDQVVPRNAKDVLGWHGEDNHGDVAVAVRLLWLRLEHSTVAGGGGLRGDVVLDLVKEHPGLVESVAKVVEINEGNDQLLKGLISLGYAGCLHYLTKEAYSAKKADTFFTLLASGDKIGGTNPIHKLRNILLKNRSERKKLTRDALVGLTVKAINFYAAGEETNRLTLLDGEFPRLGGLDAEPEEEENAED